VALSSVLLMTGCTDGTPAFCSSLRATADLSALGEALESGDLERAGAEARRLSDLAREAPTEIRADLAALATAVEEIVDLMADEAAQGESSELERRRELLNEQLGELDVRSERVSGWALRECGLQLD
jgi:hypothetical protein